jgi:hypothetical protein
VLHDAFAVSFGQIAPIDDRTPATAKKLASRARQPSTPHRRSPPRGCSPPDVVRRTDRVAEAAGLDLTGDQRQYLDRARR